LLLLWLADDSCFLHANFSNAPSSVLVFVVVQTIPASVAAVSISTILEYVLVRPLGFETYTVNDYGPIQQNHALLPIWIKSESGYDTTLPALDTKLLGEIFLTSFFTAFIGLFESLLTMQIIDELTYVK
jgi:MFS superfamily sulfate permease-like transporter